MNAPSRPRPPKTMLLIDADNVSTDVMEQAVEALLLQFGALHVRRAYCTAESALKHQSVFKRLGIRPMVNLAAGKNSTDIALAVDALDLVIAERPDVVVIASSDSDFAPLVARLREKGCRVVGIGQQGKTGDETRTVYDDFTVLAHRKAPGRAEAGPARGRGRARGGEAGAERSGERSGERSVERSSEHPIERPADRADRAERAERPETRLDARPAGRSGSRRGGRGGARGRLQDDRMAGGPVPEVAALAGGPDLADEDRAAAARAQAVADVMADVMAETEAEASAETTTTVESAEPGVTPTPPARKSSRRRSAAPAATGAPTPDEAGSDVDVAGTAALQAPSPAGLPDADVPAARPGRSPRAASSRRSARPAATDEPVALATTVPEPASEAGLPPAPTRRRAASRTERTERPAAAAPAEKRKPASAPRSVPADAAETPPAPSPDRPRAQGRSGRARPAPAEGKGPSEAAPVAASPAEPAPPATAPASAPAVPDRLRQILMVLPELVRGDTVELRVAAERLREGGLLSRSGSSTKVLGAFPDKFELLPERNPNRVRLKT